MPLSETHLAVWLFAFARLAGWTLFDPLVSRLPISMRLFMAAVLFQPTDGEVNFLGNPFGSSQAVFR